MLLVSVDTIKEQMNFATAKLLRTTVIQTLVPLTILSG